MNKFAPKLLPNKLPVAYKAPFASMPGRPTAGIPAANPCMARPAANIPAPEPTAPNKFPCPASSMARPTPAYLAAVPNIPRLVLTRPVSPFVFNKF